MLLPLTKRILVDYCTNKYSTILSCVNTRIIVKHLSTNANFQHKLSACCVQVNSDSRFIRYVSTSLQPLPMTSTGLPLNYVVEKLNSFASSELAESWDNVGLLIQPATPQPISSILLTNDLTEAVMQEAVDLSANMIISYHPPIFAPLKSVSSRTWKERIVAKCLENRIALYSPHTSFDAVKGGVNDWLASAFDTEWVNPIIQSYISGSYLVEITVPGSDNADTALSKLRSQLDKSCATSGDESLVSNIIKTSAGSTIIQMTCSKRLLPKYQECYYNCFAASQDYQLNTSKYEQTPMVGYGMGRLCLLKTPLPVNEVVCCIKKHLKMPHLRLALAVDKDIGSPVSTIALCAGSGASVLKDVRADLLLTGEMLHHDILDAVHRGSHVVLTNHSDSERGFLSGFAETLSSRLLDGKVKVIVSKEDSDPLKTV